MTEVCQMDLSGKWFLVNAGCEVELPGSTDEMGFGPADEAQPWHPDVKELPAGGRILNRMTRRHAFCGQAVFEREVCFPAGGRVFLTVERSRALKLEVNGQEVPAFGLATLASPCRFEVTEYLTGRDRIRLTCDNTYPGEAHRSILTSSGATDETQTNWNGLLGRMELRRERENFLRELRVLCGEDGVRISVTLDCAEPYEGTVHAESDALEQVPDLQVDLPAGRHELCFAPVQPRREAEAWDLGSGHMHEVRVSGTDLEEKHAAFGIRTFGALDGMFALNGRKIFLRGETCCAAFPETGYEPMDVPAWDEVMAKYAAYGVNFVRFHSHVPPEAALEAADRRGMLVQVELNCWNPVDAMDRDGEYAYYRKELEAVLREFACHPSFVMLTMGNELHAGETGLERLRCMVRDASQMDPTRLYAIGSNPFYGRFGVDPDSGFYTSQNSGDCQMRLVSAGMKGPLNEQAPETCLDFSPTIRAIRESSTVPVCSFEIGQYEVLPELDQADLETRVLVPDNFRWMREQVEKTPMARDWDRRIQASGELALTCYRWETEAALRTQGLGGMCLLGLQDFPGQGTALVGMMDSWMRPKTGFGKPERFAAFFRDVRPLALLPRMTWRRGEVLEGSFLVCNFGRSVLKDRLHWELRGTGMVCGETEEITVLPGERKAAGSFSVRLPEGSGHEKMTLHLRYGDETNEYPVYVFGQVPAGDIPFMVTHELNEEAETCLRAGGRVLLQCEGTVQSQYSTNFWSVGTFPFQTGCMGYYLDPAHPLFRDFPTDAHTDVQWYAMASQKAMLCPEHVEPVLEIMTTPLRLRRLCQMLECRCGGGRLFISCLDLPEHGAAEAEGLWACLNAYLSSERFDPSQEMSPEEVRRMLEGGKA